VFSQKILDRELAISNWQHLLSISRIHNIINYQLPIPNSQFPITNSQFPIPYALCPIPNSQFPIPLIYCFNCRESFGIHPGNLRNASIARIFPHPLQSLATLQINFGESAMFPSWISSPVTNLKCLAQAVQKLWSLNRNPSRRPAASLDFDVFQFC